MKKFNDMGKKERKETLIKVSEEINALGFDPPLSTKGKNTEALEKQLVKANKLLEEKDEISKMAVSVFEELVGSKVPKSEKKPKAGKDDKPDKKPKPDKKDKGPKKIPMARFVDNLILAGGTIDSICKKAQAEGDARGQKQKYTKSHIDYHIAYREKETKGWTKKNKLTVTDKKITVG